MPGSKYSFSGLLYLLFCSGCLSLTSLQSGRTVGKGNMDFAPSVSFGEGLTPNQPDSSSAFNNSGPVLGINILTGLGNTTDMLVRFDLQSYIGIGFKKQLFGGETGRFAGSIGAETGINILQFLFANRNYYLTVPLNLSYEVNETVTLCAAPRFLYQDHRILSGGAGGTNGDHNSYARLGISWGFLWGRNTKFGLEISSFNGAFFQPSQVSTGVIFNFNAEREKRQRKQRVIRRQII